LWARLRKHCSGHAQVLQDPGKHARELNKETGEIQAYIYKTVVADEEQIEDPVNQITLTEANEMAPGVEVGSEIRIYRDTSPLGRIAAQLPSRSFFKRSARRSAIRFSRSTRTAKKKC